MSGLVRVCSISDVPEGQIKTFRVNGKDVLIATIDGRFYSMGAWCTHEDGPLHEGTLSGMILTCPDHSAQFDLRDGSVNMGPSGDDPSTINPEPVYEVVVQGDDIMLKM
jgi:nitrite reductase/ring-hydroxylating ferredoxin subunit